MLGFVLAFPGVRTGRIYLHSHMTAVLPEHQNRGIGRQLKLAQRDDALARGIDLIEWTFDSLQLRNAYFNIVRLGVIVRQYLPNVYGRTTSSLDAHLGHESSGTTADLYVVEIPDEVRRTQERYAAEIDALGAPNKPPKAERKPPVRKRSTAKIYATGRKLSSRMAVSY